MKEKALEVLAAGVGIEAITLLGCIPVVAPIDGTWADLPVSMWVFLAIGCAFAVGGLAAFGLFALCDRINSYEV